MRVTKVQFIGILAFIICSFNAVAQQVAQGKYYVNIPQQSADKPVVVGQLLPLLNGGSAVKIGETEFLIDAPDISEADLYRKLHASFVSPIYIKGKYLAAEKNRIVIKLKDNANERRFLSIADNLSLSNVVKSPLMANTWFAYRETNIDFSVDKRDAWRQLLNYDFVAYAEPDILFTPVVPSIQSNDPLFNRQWAITNTGSAQQFNGTPGADMKVEGAWSISGGSPDVRIGVMDSGVDTLHPDLLPNLLPGFDANSDSVDTKGYPTPNFDDDGHGTCCAGICAAAINNAEGIAGVAPFCKIVPIRMFYYLNFGGQVIPLSSSVDAATGISWAWQNGVDVLSNSWGVPDSLIPFLGDPQVVVDAGLEAIANGRNGNGMLMLYSSGNDNSTTILLPARYPEVISVNASSMCDERKSPQSCDNETWWGGNYGDSLDVSAPGVKIATTDMLGTKGYGNGSYYYTFNGTSAACPNAAGVMGLILSMNRNLPYNNARFILENSADRTGGYDYSANKASGSWSFELGYGRVNAYKAVLAAQSTVGITNNGAKEFTAYVYYGADGMPYLNLNADKPSNVTIALYDVMGRFIENVYTGSNVNQLNNMPLTISAAGMYLVRVNVNGSSYGIKVVKK
ncbi:MAG: S8 family peptidase [Sphingobacteriales bacterium JAD_PAG50586_3]|nr:MAG: S8 family peptidase [Sphingobacteriales bacterium JAD_PAG50586_3]